MSSGSEDDSLEDHIAQMVTSDMDSIVLRYPKLFGLTNRLEMDIAFAKPDDFRTYFKMSRQCFWSLMNKITTRTRVVDLKKKLLYSIWMLCTREDVESASSRFKIGFNGHQAFQEILDAISGLMSDYVKWPAVSQYQQISKAFKDKSGGLIPGIVGAIDACHIEIKKPRDEHQQYVNEKQTYSIILQAICDHRNIFTDVFVGSPGSFCKSTVFSQSNLYKHIDNLIPGEYHIIGDSTYPLIQNLITPFSDENLEQKVRFNRALKNAATSIDTTLKILQGRFRILKYLDVSDPVVANKIICSCVNLHNHIKMFDNAEKDDKEFINIEPFQKIESNSLKWEPSADQEDAGLRKRNYLMSL